MEKLPARIGINIAHKEATKPNCYKCQWRGTIPGDCHSRCLHPSIKYPEQRSFLKDLIAMAEGQFIDAIHALEISGDPHGIRMGWFFWPVNFDPTWLRSCNGFEAKQSPG
jgi:hypothetical protein